MSWSHIHKVASELSLKINTTIKDPTRNLEWTEIEISSDNGQEIRKE